MVFIYKRRRNTAIIVGLVGLMLLLGAVGISPTRASSVYLSTLFVPQQRVRFTNAAGVDKSANFFVNVTGKTDGTASGTTKLELTDEGITYEIMQFVDFIEHELQAAGQIEDPIIRVEVLASLNGRPLQPFIDPTVDLSQERYGLFDHATWVMPIQFEVSGQMLAEN